MKKSDSCNEYKGPLEVLHCRKGFVRATEFIWFRPAVNIHLDKYRLKYRLRERALDYVASLSWCYSDVSLKSLTRPSQNVFSIRDAFSRGAAIISFQTEKKKKK